ncbi:hypothetical protein ACLB9X_32545 [Streptomyces sp. 5K101]|uniref:hypothetical protein n=1 Tax=Streptomyces sp. 5K101 TaxID=3390037 RepID=UPI003976B826
MLGSATEAEDAVQDAYVRFSGADRTAIEAGCRSLWSPRTARSVRWSRRSSGTRCPRRCSSCWSG